MALSKHLEIITPEGTSKSYAPTGGQDPDAPPNPCHWCRGGDHYMCTGVECYRCPREFHPRLPGIAATYDPDDKKTVGGRFYNG